MTDSLDTLIDDLVEAGAILHEADVPVNDRIVWSTVTYDLGVTIPLGEGAMHWVEPDVQYCTRRDILFKDGLDEGPP